jgi:xylan 1,4-beta-xylosidase
MTYIQNPILRGFNPDPSILCVGEDYYIATSTFEWFPGVQIHHSRDLVHWRVLSQPLDTARLLDMRGIPNSGGIWAPCLSYADGMFYLIYTNVHTHLGAYKDTPNYLTTATSITGPWSDPVYLNSSGFDPSLFHDEDGRKWLLNQVWDHRKNRNQFAGIVLQEYSITEKKLIGEKKLIFKGTELGRTEAPHVYKRNDMYYLLTAEGGTGYEHAVTVARSVSLYGPYETDPANPMLTSFGKPELTLQKAGHASLVETPNGEWYMAHLCSRPLPGLERSPLGRETALQQVVWSEDGWLRLTNGGNSPYEQVAAPHVVEHTWKPEPERDEFDAPRLSLNWSTLREPAEESWLSLTARQGYLRLYGRESLRSAQGQSLVARRLQSLNIEVETCVDFEPDTFQQMAGLIFYYNTKHYYYLHVSWDEEQGKCLHLATEDGGVYDEPLEKDMPFSQEKCYLKATVNQADLQLFYSLNGSDWHPVGPVLDISKLSDEYCTQHGDWGFTGAFVGVCAQDLSGERKHADFAYFEYRER